jgi:hypothetical protein
MASSSKKPEVDDLADLEKLLNREASAFQREVEVDRILKAFKLNPYDILDLDGKATPEEIKKKYRQISLCKYPPSWAAPCAEVSARGEARRRRCARGRRGLYRRARTVPGWLLSV